MAGIIAESGIPLEFADGEYSAKVTTVNDVELEQQVVDALLDISSTSKSILEQLQLLNARFEESFNTKIEEEDI